MVTKAGQLIDGAKTDDSGPAWPTSYVLERRHRCADGAVLHAGVERRTSDLVATTADAGSGDGTDGPSASARPAARHGLEADDRRRRPTQWHRHDVPRAAPGAADAGSAADVGCQAGLFAATADGRTSDRSAIAAPALPQTQAFPRPVTIGGRRPQRGSTTAHAAQSLPPQLPPIQTHGWLPTIGRVVRCNGFSLQARALPPQLAPIQLGGWKPTVGAVVRRGGHVWIPSGLTPTPTLLGPIQVVRVAPTSQRAGRVTLPTFASNYVAPPPFVASTDNGSRGPLAPTQIVRWAPVRAGIRRAASTPRRGCSAARAYSNPSACRTS